MAGYQHGIYITERPTAISPMTSLGTGVVVAVGTAPLHLATEAADVHKPVIAYNLQEFTKYLGYSDDFDKYTLCEAAYTIFSLYNISPAVFINVLNPKKHFKAVSTEYGGVTENPITIAAAVDLDTLEVTSGEKIDPTVLVKDTDYSLTRTQEDEVVTVTLRILQSSKIEDNKVTVFYKTDADGEELSSEVTNVTSGAVTLNRDTIVDSVRIQTGGVNTLVKLTETDYAAEYIDNEVILTIIDDSKILDDKITVKYNEIDASKVTTADVIGTVDELGRATGIELVDSVAPLFTTNTGGTIVSILAGTIIAPKYSYDEKIAVALKSKAQKVSGMFPSMAVVDLDTSKATNYQDAADLKIKNALNDPHTIVCWPKVRLSDRQFHMSTHLAALMQSVDYSEGGEVPYISPSNHLMQIGGACLSDGTEIFLTRDQANYLNGNGICTCLNIAGWRFWGNRCSSYPAESEPRQNMIPVRRMFNYIHNTLITSYFSSLDQPLTRRLIDSIMQRANLWLNGLTARGALLGARVEFSMDNNTIEELADGCVRFSLYITPPSPAREIHFELSYDLDYLNTLFG